MAPFTSILFGPEAPRPAPEPACFRDLNLDRIVASAIKSREEYELAEFFHQPATTLDAIAWRHEVFRDLEKPGVATALNTFATEMHEVRDLLHKAAKLHYLYQRESVFTDTALRYGEAAEALLEGLSQTETASRGLRGFQEWLRSYLASDGYQRLVTEAAKVQSALADVAYEMIITGDSVRVQRYADEPDYSAEVTAAFEKFQQGTVGNYGRKRPSDLGMGHVEAGVLERVAKLFPEPFAALDAFARGHAQFVDPVIERFDREIQFYLAWRAHIAPLRQAGLAFCYPEMSDTTKAIKDVDCFDLALAEKLVGTGKQIVINEFHLDGPERIIVVSGPNQGGKTTFARMYGQLHYLGALGCPVPGRDARLWLFDTIFTHFEREESITTERGKLEDDLFRIHEILEQATPASIVIINEIFTSTSLVDAVSLGQKVLNRIIALDLLCTCVTFIDELAGLGESVVSMLSTVEPDNPARRTFKVVRKPADGNAFAIFLARHYGLTSAQITERIAP